jgi:hypothetical protein
MAREIHRSTRRWLKDLGASTHICKDHDAFTTFYPHVSTINGIQSDIPPLAVKGIGDIPLRCFIPGQKDMFVTLRDISYCPKASDNLISEGCIDKAGFKYLGQGGDIYGEKQDKKNHNGRQPT